MTTDTRKAPAEKETFAQAERRKRDERFRKRLAADPDLTTTQLAESFGIKPHEVNRWCDRLGLPRRPQEPGTSDIQRAGGGAFAWAMGSRR